MSIQLTFNKKTISVSSLPNTFSGAKAAILKAFNGAIPTENITLKITFLNRSHKLQTMLVSGEPHYRAFVSQLSTSVIKITVEVEPVFTVKEKRDIVTIEDEITKDVVYVNFKDTKEDNIMHTEENTTPSKPVQTNLTSTPKVTPNLKETKEVKETKERPATAVKTDRKTVQPNMTASSFHKPSRSLEFVCDECGQRFSGRVRYRSTGVEDYDLCEGCMSEVEHPHTMIEYIDGKATRKIEPRYPTRQQRYSNPYTARDPFSSFGFPTYAGYSTPRANRGGFDNFFPFRF